MTRYSKIRQNMVACQLQTNGVTARDVLYAFSVVPREKFLCEDQQGGAYVDEDIFLPEGGFMMEPLVLGRMLQAAAPVYEDIVLNVGDETGYSSAILSGLVTTIVALESRRGQLDRGRRIWAAMDFCNIAIVEGRAGEGCSRHAPYSLILVNGAVSHVPKMLVEQLDFNGRLVCVLRTGERQAGQIVLVQKNSAGILSYSTLQDALTPWLEGCAPQRKFAF